MPHPKTGNGVVLGLIDAMQDVEIGHYSIVGGKDKVVKLGKNIEIGHFCIIDIEVVLSDDVIVENHCHIGIGTTIGAYSQILYGAQIFERVRVGARCIIGGDVIDDAQIGDDVTYMGDMAHSYREPGDINAWDTMKQPSPIIGNKCVIGERALLIGGISIGDGSVVSAGEIVRCDVQPGTVVLKGEHHPIEKFRGLIRARD